MELKTQQYLEVSQSVSLLGQKKQEMLNYIQQYKQHYEKQVKHVKQMQKYAEQLQNTQQQLKIKIQSKQDQLQEMDIQTSVKIEQKQQELEQLQNLQIQNKNNFKKQQYKLQEDAHSVEQFIEQQTDKLKQLESDKLNISKKLNEQINSITSEKIVLKNIQEDQQNKLQLVQQVVQDLEQLESVDDQFAHTLQLQIHNLSEQINQITDSIIQLKQQSSNLKTIISQLQDQENQKKNEINRQIKILQDQKKFYQDQFKNIEEKQQNEVKQLNETFLELSNQYYSQQKLLSDLNNQLDQVNDQEKIVYNQIGEANQNLYEQREKLNIQFQHYQKKENSISELHLDEKKTIQIQQEKLQARYQEFTQSYEHHCNEIISLKSSYETTINNMKKKILDLNQQLQQYELQLKKNDEEEQEFKPQYYIVNKGKGKYIQKPKQNIKIEEEEVQESASESDDEHYNVVVKFQTKNKIKSSKKKINIELENGTYYLTYNGYILKTKKDENILLDCRKSAKKNYNFSYRVQLFDQIDQQSNSKWTIKNNKVHKLKIGAISGSKVFLKVQQQSILNQHLAVGNNQLYYGFYVQDDIKYPMILKGIEIDKLGSIQGQGTDSHGKFDINGNLNLQTNQFQFYKQYLDYGKNYIDSFKGISVNYEGSYDNGIFKGTWNLQDGEGDFELKKSFRIYNYRGYFLQDGAKTETEFSLSQTSKDQVEGIGQDEVGEFTMAGNLAQDGTLTLTKSYRSHEVKYTGMIQGNRFRGIWTINDVTGEFEVQDIQY